MGIGTKIWKKISSKLGGSGDDVMDEILAMAPSPTKNMDAYNKSVRNSLNADPIFANNQETIEAKIAEKFKKQKVLDSSASNDAMADIRALNADSRQLSDIAANSSGFSKVVATEQAMTAASQAKMASGGVTAYPTPGITDRFLGARGPQKVGGALLTAWMVNQMSADRGAQSNPQLYGQ